MRVGGSPSLFGGCAPLALRRPRPARPGLQRLQLGALLLAVLIANYVTQDGESTWFEGVQLLAVYAVLGLAFYYA